MRLGLPSEWETNNVQCRYDEDASNTDVWSIFYLFWPESIIAAIHFIKNQDPQSGSVRIATLECE